MDYMDQIREDIDRENAIADSAVAENLRQASYSHPSPDFVDLPSYREQTPLPDVSPGEGQAPQPQEATPVPGSQEMALSGQLIGSATQDLNATIPTYQARPNPIHQETSAVADARVNAAQSSGEASREVAQMMPAHQFEQARIYQDAANEMQQRRIDYEAKQNALEEHMARDIEAQKSVDNEIEKISTELQNAPSIDPGRYWKNQSAGVKFLAIASAMAESFANVAMSVATHSPVHNDYMRHINDAIQKDILSQKSELDNRRTAFDARMQQLQGKRNMLGDLLANGASMREAEAMLEAGRLNEFKARLNGEIARQGGQVDQAQLGAVNAQIDQQIAEAKLMAKRLRLSQPKTIVSAVRVSPEEAKALEMLAKSKLEMAGEAQKAGFKAASEVDEKKKFGGLTSEAFVRGLDKYGENLSQLEDAKHDAQKFLDEFKEKDIPGVDPGIIGKDWESWGDIPFMDKQLATEEARDAQMRLDKIFQGFRTAVTGAGAPLDEIKRLEKTFYGSKTEADVRNSLGQMVEKVEERLKSVERRTPEAIRQEYARNPRLAPVPGAARTYGAEPPPSAKPIE